jgi:hypothetical protein
MGGDLLVSIANHTVEHRAGPLQVSVSSVSAARIDPWAGRCWSGPQQSEEAKGAAALAEPMVKREARQNVAAEVDLHPPETPTLHDLGCWYVPYDLSRVEKGPLLHQQNGLSLVDGIAVSPGEGNTVFVSLG